MKRVGIWAATLLALVISGGWALFALRHTAVVLFAALLFILLCWRLHKSKTLVASCWAVFLVATLLPIDIYSDHRAGLHPRLLPILWGLPSSEGLLLIKDGKVWPGGDVVSGWNAKWALIL
jgi:hypothetical protein